MAFKMAPHEKTRWYGVPILKKTHNIPENRDKNISFAENNIKIPSADFIDMRELESAFNEVWVEIEKIIKSPDKDAIFSISSLTREFPLPLDEYEYHILAVATLVSIADKDAVFGYSIVMEITDCYMKKAINPPTIYKTLKKLIDRGFLENIGRERDSETHRLSQHYRINAQGRAAFRAAVLNAQVLESVQARHAA